MDEMKSAIVFLIYNKISIFNHPAVEMTNS